VRALLTTLSITSTLLLFGCGGDSPAPPQNYTVGGLVSGLNGAVALENNSVDTLSLATNGSFVFSQTLQRGGTYSVVVSSQPTGQTCVVSGGAGTVLGNVSSVSVACTTNSYPVGGTVSGLTSGQLVLANGSDSLTLSAGATSFTFPTPVNYGSMYAVSVAALPPQGACHLVGGNGTVLGPVTSVSVSCGYGLWAWMSGSMQAGDAGTYGTEGQAAPNNTPGARSAAASWSDASGRLWLFGGSGQNFTATYGDLWNYSPSSGLWTWVAGSAQANSLATYPTPGTSSAGAAPGARSDAAHWTDANGNFWLFGGSGCSSNSCGDLLNDLWEYNVAIGQWSWIGGTDVTAATVTQGNYGTQGTAAASNHPGGRYDAATWVDASGNLWLFGGYGYDANPSDPLAWLNDLWKYSPSSGLWTWMGGSSVSGASPSYGIRGIAASTNDPGARQDTATWTDSAGNLWMFGGYGHNFAGTGGAYFSDLWEYMPPTGQWTWIGGPNSVDVGSVYGTRGIPSATNQPGARHYAGFWTDRSGNFWLFGGEPLSSASVGYLNDLWSYNIASGQWTWVGGSNAGNASSTYGAVGVAAIGNAPGARDQPITWSDASGNLWLLGGLNYTPADQSFVNYNDLWRFTPAP
jgi:N-acetylneuraminic acid mutarotase